MSLACPSLLAEHYPGLCVAVDIYCERCSVALDAEPVNAFANGAFLIGAVAAWRLHSRHPSREAAGLIRVLIAMMAVVGLGSFVFHTVATMWAQWADVIPILVFILLYLWLILIHFFHWPHWLAALTLSIFLAATLYLEEEIPVRVLWGGAMYLPTLLAIVTLSVGLRRQPAAGRAMLAATAVFIAAFAARTLDMPICATFPLGTHFLWHLLNALLLYLLLRLAILHMPPSSPSDRPIRLEAVAAG
jgi:hypothetical protein